MDFETKYGSTIPQLTLKQYFEKLTGRIFKILPLKEEGVSTVDTYIDSLLLEICGCERLITKNLCVLELVVHIEALHLVINDMAKFRSQVLKCVKLCKKISDNVGSDDFGL